MNQPSKSAPASAADSGYAPRERGLIRRDRILDAATEVFMQYGYEAASLQEIVSRAGGSLATLYRLFGNKEGLFQSMIERKSQRLLEELDLPHVSGKDPQTVLYNVGISFLDVVLSPDAMSLHRLLIAESGRNPRLREIFLETAPERSTKAVADYLESQVKAGRLALDDCSLAAGQFLSMLKGSYHMRSLMGEEIVLSDAERDRVVRHAIRLFLRGCGSANHT